MKTYPECFTCLVKLANYTMDTAEVESETKYEILRNVLQVIQEADVMVSPSEIAADTNQVIQEMTGIEDMYLAIKEANTIEAQVLYPQLKALVANAADPLEMAIRISAAGNIIDVVHVDDYDLWQIVEDAVSQPLEGNGLETFRAALQTTSSLLYLADNAGETVFDRVLIETLEIPVTYVVKGGPIMNDATHAEALSAHIDQVARIVSSGSSSPGTALSRCSPEFIETFQQAELILAKGQANYETLEDLGNENLFFLLRIKCPIIARHIGFAQGNVVFHNTFRG
jgi:damage-control phosphatase, subfamily I